MLRSLRAICQDLTLPAHNRPVMLIHHQIIFHNRCNVRLHHIISSSVLQESLLHCLYHLTFLSNAQQQFLMKQVPWYARLLRLNHHRCFFCLLVCFCHHLMCSLCFGGFALPRLHECVVCVADKILFCLNKQIQSQNHSLNNFSTTLERRLQILTAQHYGGNLRKMLCLWQSTP